uniref:Protein DPCD n=1 Tax=Myxobolus squamalis TaxID=59785 RepID=A0A6B2FZT2_MYXSQ
MLYRVDSKDHFMWKLKNIPFPVEVFRIEVENDQIVIRTTNNKYLKKFRIPDMDRFNYKIKQDDITFFHHSCILTIMYSKPKEIVENEQNTLNAVEQHAITMAESNGIPEV